MSNLIIFVIQEKKSRSNNGTSKQITIMPEIKFQGKNWSQLSRCTINKKKLHDLFCQPNVLMWSVQKSALKMQQILKTLNPETCRLRHEIHSPEK